MVPPATETLVSSVSSPMATTHVPARSTSPMSTASVSSGSSSGSSASASSSSSSTKNSGNQAPNPKKGRVLWVGNVPPTVHHDELRDIFRVAIHVFRPDIRVTHVTVKYHRDRTCNSATVFLNRGVDIETLQAQLRITAKQHRLKIRKCKRNRRGNPRSAKVQAESAHSQRHMSVTEAAQAAVCDFLTHHYRPPPAEVGLGSRALDDFVLELEQSREDRTFMLMPWATAQA